MSRRFDLWHPSDRRLRAWLESDGPSGVSEHVERCERCADRLVALDQDLEALETATLGQALVALLAPPDDLSQRVLEGVDARRRNEADLQLIAGLFSIGVETAQLMLSPDEGASVGDDVGGDTGPPRTEGRSDAADEPTNDQEDEPT